MPDNVARVKQMTPYENLIAIIDRLRAEAPPTYKSYHPDPSDAEALNAARARAFLHLFLKARFGLLTFGEREPFVTEGAYDGGIDAFYLDADRKVVYFLQSKFRATEKNFEEKSIGAEELLMMDIGRILEGETLTESGAAYNSKILAMARRIREISDIGRYRYQVVILANARAITRQKLTTLTGGFPAEVIDYKACYAELLFPLVSGTYYRAHELQLSLSLSNKSAGAKISYTVTTEVTKCEITVVFVPTVEIAKAMFKYRNSILQYNPRSYLGHAGANVNSEIRRSIENRSTNEFALFNNGITILSDETYLNERIGQKERAQLVLINPQIINGGQTAYTLSVIYREHMDGGFEALFEGKEVLVKIITFQEGAGLPEASKLSLIEEISRATNQQSVVTAVDRRSNEPSIKKLQKRLFDVAGMFLERKRGEFEDGQREGYIAASDVVERTQFFRAALTAQGRFAEALRRKVLQEVDFDGLANAGDDAFERYAFATLLLRRIVDQPRAVRISGSVVEKLYFGIASAFEPGLTIREREARVAETAATVDESWNAFQSFAVSAGHMPITAMRKERKIYGPRKAYLVSEQFRSDLALFQRRPTGQWRIDSEGRRPNSR